MNATDGLFHQPLTPIGGSLAGSFLVGIIPILVVLVLLGIVRLAAWLSSAIGLVVGIFIAIFGWKVCTSSCAASNHSSLRYGLAAERVVRGREKTFKIKAHGSSADHTFFFQIDASKIGLFIDSKRDLLWVMAHHVDCYQCHDHIQPDGQIGKI